LADALDYAAAGNTGMNFYNGRGQLTAVQTYAELAREARAAALRLHSLNLPRGSRVALVADTHPDFTLLFYACQYASLVPVPLPAAVHLGGADAYVQHLSLMLRDCKAAAAFAPEGFTDFLQKAARGLSLSIAGSRELLETLQPADTLPEPAQPDDLAYLQYTSGSTRFPRGTMITQRAVLKNLSSILGEGLRVNEQDRFFSWLPFYHDMGLVGHVLGSVVSQRTVDYMGSRDFAMRPRLWPALMSQNGSTISFSPPFGYALCARRLKPSDVDRLDLSAWRVAGIGAEMIRPQWLRQFAEVLEPAGFQSAAFVPCYGMAECSLGVSFAELGSGLSVDCLDAEALASRGEAIPFVGDPGQTHGEFVNCGRPLSEFAVDIRDADGVVLGERHCGRIFLKGPSLMIGYFANPEISAAVLSNDGWLDTGDLGYMAGRELYITGRAKDLLIINGRNIWPQDLEQLAEQHPEVRVQDASAFAVPGEGDADVAVLVVQCRETDASLRAELADRITQSVAAGFGITCLVELVPPHTLPRTSSGKLSRSLARKQFLARREQPVTAQLLFLEQGGKGRIPPAPLSQDDLINPAGAESSALQSLVRPGSSGAA
jgi:fatty-acyl-CoA synthase